MDDILHTISDIGWGSVFSSGYGILRLDEGRNKDFYRLSILASSWPSHHLSSVGIIGWTSTNGEKNPYHP